MIDILKNRIHCRFAVDTMNSESNFIHKIFQKAQPNTGRIHAWNGFAQIGPFYDIAKPHIYCNSMSSEWRRVPGSRNSGTMSFQGVIHRKDYKKLHLHNFKEVLENDHWIRLECKSLLESHLQLLGPLKPAMTFSLPIRFSRFRRGSYGRIFAWLHGRLR